MPRRSTRTSRSSLQARHPGRFNIWRDIDSYSDVHAETVELIRFLDLEGIEHVQSGELSYGGQRLVDLGIALGLEAAGAFTRRPTRRPRGCPTRACFEILIKSIALNIPVLIVEHDIDRVLAFLVTSR